MNQVALVGNITDDPELRYTQSGAALAGFTVAVSHRSKHNGEWQDVNDGFFRCTAWRSVAENAAHTLKKGMRILVAGKLVQRSWQDNDGNKRQSVEIQSHMWDQIFSSQSLRWPSPPQRVRSRPRTVLRLRPRPTKSRVRSKIR
jgi:single stranded DNA-binding protein